jgi:hypothetical protein
MGKAQRPGNPEQFVDIYIILAVGNWILSGH